MKCDFELILYLLHCILLFDRLPVLRQHAVKVDVSLRSHFEAGVHHHCFYLNNSDLIVEPDLYLQPAYLLGAEVKTYKVPLKCFLLFHPDRG